MRQAVKKRDSGLSFLETPIPGLNITSAIVLWLALTTIVPLLLVATLPNTLGLAIFVFNNLNILIAFCEIALGNHIRFIQKDYLRLRKNYEGKEWSAAFAYLLMPLSLSTLFSGEKWAIMWSTYSLWDPSYQNQESFGFFIDVGNGWSTIPPCVLWNAAILFPSQTQYAWMHSWLLVGTLGCASYWQVLYGTIIYFLSFIFNKRYVGRPVAEVAGFVGVANGIWFFFPMAALYAAVLILRDQDMEAVFR
jgi:hypothetical protein